MTVCRKVCSQNRPNNAFPCVTPLLVIKNIPCLTIIEFASKNTKASSSLQQCTCADFFSQTNPKTKLNYCYGHDIAPCFFCLSFTAMRCRPFLLRCVDKFLWYFASFLFQGSDHLFWGPLLTSPKCIFLLARGLRAACARNAT